MKSLFLSSLLALGLLAVPAQAAEYPAKPITLMTVSYTHLTLPTKA